MTLKQAIREDIHKMNFTKKDLQYVLAMVFSSFLYSFGMNSFVKSGNLFPSGFAGISRLISGLLDTYCQINISFGVIYFTLNIIVTVVVLRYIGHKFILYSFLWFSLTSFFTEVIQVAPITHEMLLIAVFGGLINGASIGIALRNNGSSGGTDFIAIYFSMKFNRPIWNYIMAANALVLVIAGLTYGWTSALYSIIFQFVSTQVINELHKRYRLTSLHIITNTPEEVCQAMFHTCRHGITKVKCEGGYTDQEHWLLLTTINTYQLKEVTDAVKAVDPKAFITIFNTERIIGNYFQKPLE